MFHRAMEMNTFCLYNNRERDVKVEMPTSFSVCTLGGASNTYFRYHIFTHTNTYSVTDSLCLALHLGNEQKHLRLISKS